MSNAVQRAWHRFRVRRISSLPSLSLVTRAAIASALGATIIVVTVATFVWSRIESDQYAQLDQRLEAVTAIARSVSAQSLFTARDRLPEDFEATYRSENFLIPARRLQIPNLPDGFTTRTLRGETYRIFTVTLVDRPRASISVAVPTASTDKRITDDRRNVLVVSTLSVAAAAGLGWLFAGFAIRPLRLLTEQTRRITADNLKPMTHVTGATEAEELSHAITSMLARITREQNRKNQALETARDFAAVSAHELRTPLTAIRTNLEVLESLDPPPEDRHVIVGETLRSITRIEQTLRALERLAAGELTQQTDYSDVDIPDLLDRSAQEASRVFPDVDIRLGHVDSVTVRGLAEGLRLAVDNAITNAVKHGRASVVELTTEHQRNNFLDITIDDDGCGIPMNEWESVFHRFNRGSNTTRTGSGLGLSLVEQQADLHGGRAFISNSTLGGTRLTLRIRTATT
ncbi:HAMP domain-containing histidine kinase [Hoyosella rhizosphaerae]|uniref:histidine kinase n=1 Tax=Hoyosella rhizosphaerae TaxID=1755582 RepID=A0A916XHR7_9ACTN|nr:HAMP domain-containing sensor histidine kinase [Hoyosella rhizosphaerae]MBN4928178.1 HAMP domain-containing histidine kinase [Hoyosella rhizosphaerae]GGC73020.1 sensor-type histidine kinase PrrB [Hoyosella rhizosphaerae]